jgi:RsiW-degrading membrane proteinase PrsW (M82 family)
LAHRRKQAVLGRLSGSCRSIQHRLFQAGAGLARSADQHRRKQAVLGKLSTLCESIQHRLFQAGAALARSADRVLTLRNCRVAIALTAALLLASTVPVLADDPLPESDAELARRYAPVFYFHPAEIFRPQPVDVIVERARLRQTRRLWFDVNVLLRLDVLDLFDFETDESHFLDVWYGDDGSSKYTNYSAHQAFYEAMLSPEAGGPPVAVYAHVVRDEDPDHITIQYWALYFYNDWFNKHEGDWELVQVTLNAEGEPEWVVLAQHHGGACRAWARAPVEEGTHPVVHVALGSHANYFVGDEIYPNGRDVGRTRIEILDRTGYDGRVIPEVTLLPDRADLAADPGAWPGAEWLSYQGRWGEVAVQSDFAGPLGPADKGAQWKQPYAWGMAQPLDTDTWYSNRLRVEVVGAAAEEVQIRLTDARGGALPAAEELGSLAILHVDPPAGTDLVASIGVPPETHWDVVATWPDATSEQVTRARFTGVDFAETGRARLEFGTDGAMNLLTRCLPGEEGLAGGCLASQGPTATETVEATWDAPELVWIGTVLPAHQVGTGLLLATLGAVVPTLAYVGALYWVDRYEKEPRRLLAAAFVWGAIPSLALALAAEVFFRLPPDLLGTLALEAARLGLVAPVVQEASKGAVVLLISWRYRREFDNVLDGIIYGAMVGFGFAMTGNLISTVGRFALWGFEGLGAAVFAEGLVYGLDHALYTAAFGAGLGLARLARERWQRWALPAGGFGLAVATHVLHDMLARNLLGLNVATVVATGAGLILAGIVAGWSLARQQRWLRVELEGEVPSALYRTMVTPGARTRAQWRALRAGGLSDWRRARGLHQLCAELAFKKMQRRQRGDGSEIAQEIERLRREIGIGGRVEGEG